MNALLSTPDQQDAEDKKVIEEAKETIDETEAKEAEEGAVINIQVIEEKKDDADVLDIVKAAEEAFVAEVIPDNEEVDITPDEGEEVIEYTLNTADAIPIGAIAVATFAIFLALIFFYNWGLISMRFIFYHLFVQIQDNKTRCTIKNILGYMSLASVFFFTIK